MLKMFKMAVVTMATEKEGKLRVLNNGRNFTGRLYLKGKTYFDVIFDLPFDQKVTDWCQFRYCLYTVTRVLVPLKCDHVCS